MKFGVSWSVNDIRPEASETAREAARRSGVSLDEWLNAVIMQRAEQEGVQAPPLANNPGSDAVKAPRERPDLMTQRIEQQLARSGPAAYAPKHGRQGSNQSADVAPQQQAVTPPPIPGVRLPPSLDRALAEIAGRQRMFKGNAVPAPPQPQGLPAAPAPAPMPLPAQDLSGLEDQLHNITNQIKALYNPGIEQAINALRSELGEIGRTLSDVMPARAIEAIEEQIQDLSRRVVEGRQAGIYAGALGSIEQGLAEIRDALREMTLAENLVGFNDAITGLAHKIDLIVEQKDPAIPAQLERAIAMLREMSTHIASDETVHGLAAQVQVLGEKVEAMDSAGTGGDTLSHLDQRITAISSALTDLTQSGAVPQRLEALVESLAGKIEQIQHAHEHNDAFGLLEDRIVKLVEKLDASDSRLSHLEAIERGLADLLAHVEANKNSGSSADASRGVNDLQHDIARTQDALESIHGTLGHVVDRLATIEKDIRGSRPHGTTGDEVTTGRNAVSTIERAASAAEPASSLPVNRGLPPAVQMPIDSNLPPDQPLEPGSGPPPLRANPATRIAASESALGAARSATPAGRQSGFIAAARRAAQAAGQEPRARASRSESIEARGPGVSSLRAKMMKRVKSLFVAASIVAIVIGSIQIAGNVLNLGHSATKSAQDRAAGAGKTGVAERNAASEPATSAASDPLALPKLTAMPPLALTSDNASIAAVPEFGPNTLTVPSLFGPPMLSPNSDVTGSIARTTDSQPTATATQPNQQTADRLPIAIGGSRLRSAAVAGDAAAVYEVGVRYAEGHGVPVDMEEAARWYERSASKGLAPAQFRYASLLEKGRGVKKDLVQARRLYLAAATKGNGKAMHNLAVLYAEGIDGKPDYSAAAQWFRKASLRGIADSQYNLGVLCARGLGTAKSYVEAYKWFALAAAQGDHESAKKRDDLGAHMNAEALATAQDAVKSFVAEPQPKEATVVPEPPGGWDNAAAAPPRARQVGPLSLGSFQVGKR